MENGQTHRPGNRNARTALAICFDGVAAAVAAMKQYIYVYTLFKQWVYFMQLKEETGLANLAKRSPAAVVHSFCIYHFS